MKRAETLKLRQCDAADPKGTRRYNGPLLLFANIYVQGRITVGEVGRFRDAEAAAEAGRRSAEVRRRKAQMSPEERALDAIGGKLGDLTKELLEAALGKGDFENLKPETRLTAILRAMEWKLGKAPTARRSEPDESPEVPTAEGLFGGTPAPDQGAA